MNYRTIQFILLVFIVEFLMTFSYQLRSEQRVNKEQVQDIKNHMDTTKNPCEDFYNYACGNWSYHHTTDDYTEVTGLIDFKLNNVLINILDNFEPTTDVNNYMNKIWIYYKSCTHEFNFLYKKYLEITKPANNLEWPLLQQLNDINAKWAKEEFNWLLTIAELRKYGLNNVLMEQLVLPKQNTSTQSKIIDFDMPRIDDDNTLPGSDGLIIILKELGATRLTASKISKEILDFEGRLIKLIENIQESELIISTLEDIETIYPVIEWRNYMKIIFGRNPTNDFELSIRNFAYFEKLKRLIKRTHKQTVCNYIMMKYLIYLGNDSMNSNKKIDCMADVRSKMDLAINFLYKENVYQLKSATYDADMKELLEHLRMQFLVKLSQNKLHMNDEEREYLENKLIKMELNIGNIPKIATSDYINNYYKNVELEINNYYANHLKLLNLRFKNIHQDLFETKQKSSDEFFFIADSDTAQSSTAFYLMYRNLIVVPFGSLQPPMYHHNLHDIFKLSLFGFLMAHELAHGFDVSGVMYDSQGQMKEIGFNITENRKFISSRKCMEREETISIDERMADLVGIRLAYDALFGLGIESGLNTEQPTFTDIPVKRLFFLNFAQFFCGNLEGIFQNHDADNVRLHETLMNFQPFADVYNCQFGDAMHPAKKCRLW